MNTRIVIVLAATLAGTLAACGRPEPEENKVADTGRKETRVIEAADGIGYGNSGVRKKLDKALDTNDQRVDQLNQDIDKQSQ